MNVLMLVMTMLMLLTIMTTSRLQSYLDFTDVRRLYHDYVQNVERHYLKVSMKELYDRQKTPTGGKRGPVLNSTLDFSIFLKWPRQEDQRFLDMRDIATRLIAILGKDPSAAQEIVNRILDSEHQNISTNEDLADIRVEREEDDPIRALYSLILGGRRGSPPLSKYVSVKKKKGQISIYLARRELLQAIFESDDIVEQIVRARNDIRRGYNSKSPEIELYRKSSEEQLKSLAGLHRYAGLLDFRVSGTNPPGYADKQ